MMLAALKAIGLGATIAIGAAVLPPSAAAGTYAVSACSPTASAGLWAPINSFPMSFATGNLCGGPEVGPTDGGNQGGLYSEDILNAPSSIPDGASAGWIFDAPPGTTITSIRYYRHLAVHANRNMFAGLYQADGTPLEECRIEIPLGSPITCERPNNQAPTTFVGLNTSSLFLGVMCRIVVPAGGCSAGGAPLHDARAVMYSARVTLSEGSTPSVADVGGPLWGGGVVSGVVPVTFGASDPIGIQGQVVRSDAGATLVSAPQACDFSLAQPCPQVPSGSLSVDTRRVADGPQTFSLVVTDAAGNSQVVTSPTVVVDNGGPPPPSALMATAVGGGSNVIGLAWRNPLNAPMPVTGAMVQLCDAVCPAAVAVGASGAAQVTAPGPGMYSVRLWLLDSHGKGGPHNAALASVTVPPPSTSSGPNGVRTKVTARLQGRRLRVAGTLARSGQVRVSWRSKVGSRTRGHGSRVVSVRAGRIAVTFLPRAAARRGTIRVVVRAGTRIVAQARARRG